MLRQRRKRTAAFMQIIEIYKSLQGESSYAGLPCVFVRLAGCNLRCIWCDSEYTFKGGKRMTLDEVEREVRSAVARSGDWSRSPAASRCLQEREAVALMDRLLGAGYTVLLETSGERPLEKVPPQVVKIVDVKCPDSGEGGTFRLENLQWLTARDEVKFVVASRRDYEFAREFIREHELSSRVGFGDFVAGVSQRRHGKPRRVALSGRSAGAGGVDAGRRAKCAPGIADPQVHLGAVAEGRVEGPRQAKRRLDAAPVKRLSSRRICFAVLNRRADPCCARDDKSQKRAVKIITVRDHSTSPSQFEAEME